MSNSYSEEEIMSANPFEKWLSPNYLRACVGNNSGIHVNSMDCSIIDGYKDAVDFLMEKVKDRTATIDTLVYPILFCCRHSVELSLKVLIKNFIIIYKRKKKRTTSDSFIQKLEPSLKKHDIKELVDCLEELKIIDEEIDDLEKIFDIDGEESHSNIKVISLVNLNTQMKKLVLMIICKTKYDSKKQTKGRKTIESSLHFIVDEANNILSHMSTRESEEWKDYRLESLEEIIKEGRKFGTFLTIASQRPSDISDTIISQLHNYFIHRLVNEEDLRKIYKTVAFSDKASNEMISILPPAGCLFSGIATNFPILAKINILTPDLMPKSENVDLKRIWGLQ